MIICMCDIICVTNRLLCCEDFETRIERIAQAGPRAIVLREKDLSPDEYRILAEHVMKICDRQGVECILHYFWNTASDLSAESVHLPLTQLRQLPQKQKNMFTTIGCSCHSQAEAEEAEAAGCTYIFAGHIFATDCKKNVTPRGTGFLEDVCGCVSIPVYAIGGINENNISKISAAGAKGVCLMSSLMTCENPEKYIRNLKQSWKS